MNIISNGYRIDPAPNGINLVDVERGGRWVFIPFDKIDNVIFLLKEVYYEK